MFLVRSHAARPRGLRADAWRFVRPDAARFLKPGVDPLTVFPALATDPRQRARAERTRAETIARDDADVARTIATERASLEAMKTELLRITSDLIFARVMAALRALKYSPSQPRVPGGHGRESGQWTSGSYGSGSRPRVVIDTTDWGGDATGEGDAGADNGSSFANEADGADSNPAFDSPGESIANGDLAFDAPGDRYLADDGNVPASDLRPVDGRQSDRARPYDTRLASNEDKPRLGPNARIAAIAEIGQRLLRVFRSENYLFNLFNQDTGTVSHTELDGRDIFGSNSTSPTYTSQDRTDADRMRNTLVEKYPRVMGTDNIGHKPNDALYHAETNVLLRSARENGGTLAGRSIEIYVDRPMCNSCEQVVPLVGLELGDPEMTVIDPKRIFTISGGKITSRRSR